MQINDDELLRLVKDNEAVNVEKTTTTTDVKKFGKTICAFANNIQGSNKPGYLLIGVEDDGGIVGVETTDKLQLSISELRNSGAVLPEPSIQIEVKNMEGKDIIVVEVLPSSFPPVRYKGDVWIRTGASQSRATEQEESVLTERRVSKTASFDVTPCFNAKWDDLNQNEFFQYRQQTVSADIIAENHRDLQKQMAALRLYNTDTHHPTYAGLLLLAPEPRQWLPCAYIQFLRFDGTNLGDTPISEKEIGGNLPSMLRQLDELIKVHLTTRSRPISTLREKQESDYPPWALRELVLNAVMHRDYSRSQPIRFYWYSDRIEIHNPGGLFGDAGTNFPNNNAYRNPTIAEILKNLGYVNRFGHGIIRAQQLLSENGNPEPEFHREVSMFGVVLKRAL